MNFYNDKLEIEYIDFPSICLHGRITVVVTILENGERKCHVKKFNKWQNAQKYYYEELNKYKGE